MINKEFEKTFTIYEVELLIKSVSHFIINSSDDQYDHKLRVILNKLESMLDRPIIRVSGKEQEDEQMKFELRTEQRDDIDAIVFYMKINDGETYNCALQKHSFKNRKRCVDAIVPAIIKLVNECYLSGNIFEDGIEFLQLLHRPERILLSENIFSIGDLVQLEEKDLLAMPNMGKKSIREIKEALAKYGLSLS